MTAPRALRQATREDSADLTRLVGAFYAHFGYPYSEAEKGRLLAQVLDTPSLGSLWLVLSHDGEAVGYLFLSHYFSLEFGGRTAFVDEFFIDPAHRGRGLGSRALAEAIAAARSAGITAVQLEAERLNTRAAALYLRHGFVDHDRRLLTKVVGAGP